MQSPGLRRLFVAKNCLEFASLRRVVGKQTSDDFMGVGPATISRIERGFRVIEKTARTVHQRIAPNQNFDEIFEIAPIKKKSTILTWEQISRSAAQVGRKVFKEFKPDLVITFAGPSSLFASLVMAKSLSRDQFLEITIHTAMFQRKRRSVSPARLRGFDMIDSHRFLVHVPQAVTRLRERSNKRVSIIDDTVTTGSVLENLKAYLVKKGFKPDNIQYATCVCSQNAFDGELTKPNVWSYKIKGEYRMPWGPPL